MRKARALSLILLAAAFAAPAHALEVTLSGPVMQGGLIRGATEPGSTVRVEGRAAQVDATGRFVFGIHGHHEGPLNVKITAPDGETETLALMVPAREYETQRIDGLPQKMVSPPPEVLARIKRENAAIAEVRQMDTPLPHAFTPFIWPAEGVVSGVFGSYRILNGVPKRPHYGLDIAGPVGTPIVAPAGGIIRMAEKDLYYTGGTVMLDHGHGVISVFSHMDDVTVQKGQRVEQGAPLGTIGATGRATGPHLDWRVNWFNARLDPAPLLPPRE